MGAVVSAVLIASREMPMLVSLFEIFRGLSQCVQRNPDHTRTLEAKNLVRVDRTKHNQARAD